MERIITRWERHVKPDGFCATHLGRLEITTKEPPKGEGWMKVKVRVFPAPLTYLHSEE